MLLLFWVSWNRVLGSWGGMLGPAVSTAWATGAYTHGWATQPWLSYGIIFPPVRHILINNYLHTELLIHSSQNHLLNHQQGDHNPQAWGRKGGSSDRCPLSSRRVWRGTHADSQVSALPHWVTTLLPTACYSALVWLTSTRWHCLADQHSLPPAVRHLRCQPHLQENGRLHINLSVFLRADYVGKFSFYL